MTQLLKDMEAVYKRVKELENSNKKLCMACKESINYIELLYATINSDAFGLALLKNLKDILKEAGTL